MKTKTIIIDCYDQDTFNRALETALNAFGVKDLSKVTIVPWEMEQPGFTQGRLRVNKYFVTVQVD